MDIKDMKLSDTVAMMNSDDYFERFRAEYFQLLIRHHKLLDMCQKWDSGKLDFEPTCSREIYKEQLTLMNKLLLLMEERAKIEHVNIDVSDIKVPEKPFIPDDYLTEVDDCLESLSCIYEELKDMAKFWDEFRSYFNNPTLRRFACLEYQEIRKLQGIITSNDVFKREFGKEFEKE